MDFTEKDALLEQLRNSSFDKDTAISNGETPEFDVQIRLYRRTLFSTAVLDGALALCARMVASTDRGNSLYTVYDRRKLNFSIVTELIFIRIRQGDKTGVYTPLNHRYLRKIIVLYASFLLKMRNRGTIWDATSR